jgi:hemerythrin-like metal-binding protein
MPNFVNWEDHFSVGSSDLDRQHRHLLKMCNKLGAIVSDGAESQEDDFHEVLHELAEYSRQHFMNEEHILEQVGYPNLQEQRRDHLEYTKQIAMVSYLAATMEISDKVGLQRFISNWWTEHILLHDMQYRDFLLSKSL